VNLELKTIAELVVGDILVNVVVDGSVDIHPIKYIYKEVVEKDNKNLSAFTGRNIPPSTMIWYDVDGINRRAQGHQYVIVVPNKTTESKE